jgi:hypothetical protein
MGGRLAACSNPSCEGTATRQGQCIPPVRSIQPSWSPLFSSYRVPPIAGHPSTRPPNPLHLRWRKLFHISKFIFILSQLQIQHGNMLHTYVCACLYRLGVGVNDWGSIPGTDNDGIFLFATKPKPDLGPTQPLFKWIPGFFSMWVKRRGCEVEHPPPSSTEVRDAWRYTYTPPIRLRNVVLN